MAKKNSISNSKKNPIFKWIPFPNWTFDMIAEKASSYLRRPQKFEKNLPLVMTLHGSYS